MNKFACLNPIAKIGLDNYGANFEQTEDANDAEVILVRSADMHEMEISEKLLAVGRAGAGVNNIPLDKMGEAGVVVFNSPGANANGVKELVLCGMLLAARDVVGGIGWCKANAEDENIGKSAEKAKKAYAGTEIMGKTLGVIGLGAIGAKVADAVLGLGMDVIGYDPYLSEVAAKKLNPAVKITDNLDDIYAASDYITIHVPAVDSTKGMINAEAIAKMKDGVIFLNFSRDALINEPEMISALESGKVRKYVTDFATPNMAKCDKAIVLPHLGASTAESEDNCAIMAVDETKKFIEQGSIINSVNFGRLEAGELTAVNRVLICSKGVEIKDIGVKAESVNSVMRGDFGYSVIDTNEAVDVEAIKALEGVTKVRVITK